MSMRAMVLRHTGEPLASAELPEPKPGPGQVQVEVSACAVSRTDLHGGPTMPTIPSEPSDQDGCPGPPPESRPEDEPPKGVTITQLGWNLPGRLVTRSRRAGT